VYIYRRTRYEVSGRRPFIYIGIFFFHIRVGFFLSLFFFCSLYLYRYNNINITRACFFYSLIIFFSLRRSVCSPSAHARPYRPREQITLHAREDASLRWAGVRLSARLERLNNNIIIIIVTFTISNYRFSQPPPPGGYIDSTTVCCVPVVVAGRWKYIIIITLCGPRARVNMTYMRPTAEAG